MTDRLDIVFWGHGPVSEELQRLLDGGELLSASAAGAVLDYTGLDGEDPDTWMALVRGITEDEAGEETAYEDGALGWWPVAQPFPPIDMVITWDPAADLRNAGLLPRLDDDAAEATVDAWDAECVAEIEGFAASYQAAADALTAALAAHGVHVSWTRLAGADGSEWTSHLLDQRNAAYYGDTLERRVWQAAHDIYGASNMAGEAEWEAAALIAIAPNKLASR